MKTVYIVAALLAAAVIGSYGGYLFSRPAIDETPSVTPGIKTVTAAPAADPISAPVHPSPISQPAEITPPPKQDHDSRAIDEKVTKVGIVDEPPIIPESSERLIRIDLTKQRLYGLENGQIKFTFVCSTSKSGLVLSNDEESEETHDHIGVFTVLTKQINRFSKKYRVNMPYALGYHGGHFIHATTEISRLGRRASHGCVRLSPRDAKTLYQWAKIGDTVEILR